MITDLNTHILKNNVVLLKNEITEELNAILDFWSDNVIDHAYGGFIGHINSSGKKNNTAPKGAVLNTRILWAFSAAYRATNKKEYKVIAKMQYQYIINNFWDVKNGGLYWELDYLGNPINTRKQAYAQGFGIYAFSEFYRATKLEESLLYAKELHTILEHKFYDATYTGYIEALTEDWKEIKDMRLSDKDLNAPKSMNTHLHILEPYTNLFRVWPDEGLKQNIKNLLFIFQDKIVDKNTGHFSLFYDMDWTKKSTAISFGHDIEGAWLLNEAAQAIGEPLLVKKIAELAENLTDLTLAKGLDFDGSVFNELHHGVLDKDKHWWVQAEAMVGVIDAYQNNPKEIYLETAFSLWSFIKTKIVDSKNGEWFWRVNAEGEPVLEDDKIGFWKCPYHNTRALIEVLERIIIIKNNINEY